MLAVFARRQAFLLRQYRRSSDIWRYLALFGTVLVLQIIAKFPSFVVKNSSRIAAEYYQDINSTVIVGAIG
jgi:hypothetical protein